MKKLIILLALCMCIINIHAAKSVWDGKSDTSWFNESLSEYHLTSAAQLKGFADLVSYNNTTFEGKRIYLDCDVDLNSINWTPIGLRYGQQFKGTFDGQNHEITNFYINTRSLDYPGMKDNIGLFGYAYEVKNLKIQGSMDIYESKYIGGVVGMLMGSIENIYSDITIKIRQSLSDAQIGNVVGNGTNATKIYSKGELSFDDYMYAMDQVYIGGVAGYCATMTECFSTVDLSIRKYGTTHSFVGGISGTSSQINNAIFTGSLYVDNYQCTTDVFLAEVGGISGGLSNGSNLISAPFLFAPGRGWAIGKSVVVPSRNEAIITDSYYLNIWATDKEIFGEGISEEDLKSGNSLPGFSTDIWEFVSGEYPSLISVKSLVPLPTYTIEYYVDDVLYQVDEYKEGESVVTPAEPVKEGHTFSGWGYVPPFLYGNNWIITGYFTINEYTLTFMVDNAVLAESKVKFSDRIYYPSVPDKQGYIFTWEKYDGYYMPAYDLVINGYNIKEEPEFVDLGLPSGLLWANKNIGAAKPEDYGKYYSWGEVTTKESYYWGTYLYCSGTNNGLTKYCYDESFGAADNKMVLEAEDDAATANWGDDCRLPTEEEALELYYNCTWSLGENGCYVTGPNGNSIFIPKAGKMQYKTTFNTSLEVHLLTSTLFKQDDYIEPFNAVTIFCNNNEYGIDADNRCDGYSARAVKSVNGSGINNVERSGTNGIKGIYDLNGKKTPELKKGLNIIMMSDGKPKKFMVK